MYFREEENEPRGIAEMQEMMSRKVGKYVGNFIQVFLTVSVK